MRVRKCCKRMIMLISPFIFLSGCLEFESIEQPASVLAGETFTVSVVVIVDCGEGRPYCGARLPAGWTIPGNTISYTGASNQTIHYDSALSLEQESISPSPEGYYWWVGSGNKEYLEDGLVYAEVQIQTDGQTGRFLIDYMLGSSGPVGLNDQRSDNHLIEVVDEYCPRELQAIVEGDIVSLNWIAPARSEGLVGYDVYRDGQLINTDFVLDTVYVDQNPTEELLSYEISSIYDNDDVHFMPYEIKVLVFSGGTGEPNDPYQITTAVQLASFSDADFQYLLDKCFVLVNDIDVDPNLPGGRVFDRALIAPDTSDSEGYFQGTAFTGTFDGNGFRIHNLTIAGHHYLGLVGAIDAGGQVLNLGIVDADVFGAGSHTGILAGYNSGHVTSCYSTGTVHGEWRVGGLVARNARGVTNCYSISAVTGFSDVGGLVGHNDGRIRASYSTGPVVGNEEVGGLVGFNFSDITMSYSTGVVTGTGDFIGGLVGRATGRKGKLVGIATNCFWDTQTSSLAESAGGTGKVTAKMQDIQTYLDTGWDFLGESENGLHEFWQMPEGGGYPTQVIYNGYNPPQVKGLGTAENPYLITDARELGAVIQYNHYAHFQLGASIDLSGICWDTSVIPSIAGGFDGNNLTISNLTVRGSSSVGLFGELMSGSEIRNLGVVEANIVGSEGKHFGALAGVNNDGRIDTCYSTGRIEGDRHVGGLVGENEGSVTSSYSDCAVLGNEYVGGLAGRNSNNILASHSSGTVTGVSSVGGFTGANDGDIASSCSTYTVAGNENVGGLVGRNGSYGNIAASYSTGRVSGHEYVGGLVGANWHGSITMSYSIGRVNGDERVGGLQGHNFMGSTTSSFWDTKISGWTTSEGGTGKTTDEMQTAATFLEAGWHFIDEITNGTDDIWWMPEQDYPRLWWELIPEN